MGGVGWVEGQRLLTLIFLGMGHGKTKPNQWVKRCAKMRNLHRCQCLQKIRNYDKTSKTH